MLAVCFTSHLHAWARWGIDAGSRARCSLWQASPGAVHGSSPAHLADPSSSSSLRGPRSQWHRGVDCGPEEGLLWPCREEQGEVAWEPRQQDPGPLSLVTNGATF